MAAIVEVIIGMIFIYMLLGILVSEVNSLISRAARLRARNLRGALNELIEDPVMRAKIYTHPLIRLVNEPAVAATQRISKEDAAKVASGPVGKMDWIEGQTFVDVVLNVIKAESDQQLFGALLNVIDGMPPGAQRRGLRLLVNRVVSSGAGMAELRQAVSYVQQRHLRRALNDALNQIDEDISQLGLEPNAVVSVRAGIQRIDSLNSRNALSTLTGTAQNIGEARANLETWFNQAMARASSAYAAKMKNMSIAAALLISAAINIDTLHIARTLWENPVVRQNLSGEAASAVQDGQLTTALDDEGLAGQRAAVDEADADGAVEDMLVSGAAAANSLQNIYDLSLPIGWALVDLSGLPAGHSARRHPNNLWNYSPENNPEGWLGLLLAKLLGIAATVIAAGQGAPFWFNIVNRVLRR